MFFFEFFNFSFFTTDFKFFVADFFFVYCLFLIFGFGVFFSSSYKFRFPLVVYPIHFFLLQTLLFFGYLLFNMHFTDIIFFNDMFYFTSVICHFKLFLILCTIVVSSVSVFYIFSIGLFFFEYFILFGFSFFGLNLLLCANDIIFFFLVLELQSFCFYIMISLDRTNLFSTEAGLKYFLLGAISSGFLLFGTALLYGVFGTTNLMHYEMLFFFLYDVHADIYYAGFVGVMLFFVGVLFKLGAAPFHIWVADVYQGAPTNIVLFFSTIPKFVLLYFFFNCYYNCFSEFFLLIRPFFFVVSAFSVCFGALGAVLQTNLKRFIAYSSINHVGFFLLMFLLNTFDSNVAFFFYMIVYFFFNIGFFFLILTIKKFTVPLYNGSLSVKVLFVDYTFELSGLYVFFSEMAALFVVLFFAMAGVPPFAGFFSKMYLMFLVQNSGFYFMTWFVLFFTLITAFYYIRFLKLFFFAETESVSGWICVVPFNVVNIWWFLTSLLVLNGFLMYPNFFFVTSVFFF